MIIKLAILDQNGSYMERLRDVCRKKYAEKLAISSFSVPELLKESLRTERYDVLLVDEAIPWTEDEIPEGVAFARLTEEAYQEQGGVPAVCRYQRVEQLYREVLGLYAKISVQPLKLDDCLGEGARIVAVTSASGGSGASTVAAALALSLASRKQKVIYLNLEPLGNPAFYFRGAGKESFSELLYALKSNRTNLLLRIESIVRRDASGVCFFTAPANPLERCEMTAEELSRLLQELRQNPENDVVVLDVPLSLDGVGLTALEHASCILMVQDAALTAESKLDQAIRGLQTLQNEMLGRVVLLGNRGGKPSRSDVKIAGALPEYTGVGGAQMLQAMAQHPLLQEL